MASSSSVFVLSLALFMVTSIFGHSQMRCAKYDMATGKCYAPIRDVTQSFLEEDHDISNGGPICQAPRTRPMTANYANGAGCNGPCPDPMGSISQGETFTIMWLARNHAVDDQTPGTIALYLSPDESDESKNDGLDASTSQFAAGKFCEAPFMSCNGLNGNMVQCYANCTMPSSTTAGVRTLWWKWRWAQKDKTTTYSTCADVYVTAGSGSSPSTPSIPSNPPATPKPSTTGAAPVAKPSTTGAAPIAKPSTTGAASRPVTPSTTGKVTVVTPPSVPRPAPVPVPTVPVTTSAPVVATQPTQPTGCILGSQVCVGDNKYQTCTNGRDAPYWAAPQSCSASTQCHPSTNPLALNKIYCY